MTWDAPAPLEAREARWKFVAGIMFFFVGLIISLAAAPQLTGAKQMIAWATAAGSFGFCVIGGLRLMRSPPRVIISRDGLFDERLTAQVVPWHAIETAKLLSVLGNRFVTMRIRSPDRYTPRGGVDWSRWSKRAMGELDYTLNPTNLNRPTRKVIAAFEQHFRAARGYPPW